MMTIPANTFKMDNITLVFAVIFTCFLKDLCLFTDHKQSASSYTQNRPLPKDLRVSKIQAKGIHSFRGSFSMEEAGKSRFQVKKPTASAYTSAGRIIHRVR